MPLLLAPYDDAMRLGMGFNSYTQTMCIYSYSAVEATDENMITSQTLPPKITYSSKLFEWVSEVVDTMDISRAATIKTGRMEVHGHINVLNDAKIDDAHISLMVSDELVYGIINEALLESPQPGSLEDSQVQHNFFLPSVAGYSPSETSSGVEELHTPWTSDLDSASLSGRSLVFRGKTESSTDMAMRVLVKPDVWADLLPVKIDHPTSLINQKTQTVPAFTVKYKRLHILAAVYGTHDVALKLREWSIETLEITYESESQNATFVHPSRSTCFILGVTYGGKIYSSSEDLLRFVDNADHGTPRDWLYIHFNRETIKDEHLGKDGMTGVVFYTYSILSGVQSAVSMGTAGCMLVDQRQLATVTKETVNGANDNLLKKDSKEVKTYQITLGKGIEAPEGYSCTFQSGTLKVSPSGTSFMQFENGIKFALRNNGRFEVLDKQEQDILFTI
ncbi:hypothetical protein FOBRF1_003238 [Fusarium oxysporum]